MEDVSPTVERWAAAYIASTELGYKQAPPAPPAVWQPASAPAVRAPGRPPGLVVSVDKPRSVRLGALRDPEARARLLHTFWHHELQAAELMCWGILRFPDAEPEFRRGLLGICRDEIRHMALYQEHVAALGHRVGDFPVRDWFWERVPTCASAVQFVALLGMGLEAANLEHTPRFASWFRAVGDEPGARIQEQVGREEVAHVRFAARWFRRWTARDDFDAWRESLPPPLTPLLLRGKTINREARLRAGMSADFVDRLEAWRP
jgi:uncharacterized ferritin-like protein (DUF455 family)